jgi:hypothetical protein
MSIEYKSLEGLDDLSSNLLNLTARRLEATYGNLVVGVDSDSSILRPSAYIWQKTGIWRRRPIIRIVSGIYEDLREPARYATLFDQGAEEVFMDMTSRDIGECSWIRHKIPAMAMTIGALVEDLKPFYEGQLVLGRVDSKKHHPAIEIYENFSSINKTKHLVLRSEERMKLYNSRLARTVNLLITDEIELDGKKPVASSLVYQRLAQTATDEGTGLDFRCVKRYETDVSSEEIKELSS